jgi:phosphoglycolate phosphatase-like HAD superfamily hydrolase
MIKAIIFDWSGVISDDLGLVHWISSKMLKELGKEPLSLADFREVFDLPYMDFYRSLGVTEKKEKLDRMFVRMFAENGGKRKAFPFVKKTLEWLRTKGVILAVYSAHHENLLRKEIEEYGLDGLFSHVIGGEHDKKRAFSEFIDSVGADKESVVMVGDMVHDIETGKLAGIRTAAVLSGYHTRDRLEKAGPNFMLNDVRDLRFLVEGVYA